MSENAWYADIVLPDKIYLESWHFAPTRGTPDTSHTAIRQPMANPYNLEHDAWSILWELTKRLDLRDKYVEQLNKSWGLKDMTFKAGRDYTPREGRRGHLGRQDQAGLLGRDRARLCREQARRQGTLSRGRGKQVQRARQAQDEVLRATSSSPPTRRSRISSGRTASRTSTSASTRSHYSPVPTKEHAFPTPHREATDYPFYLVTHKRMYRNQSAFTANNAILNQALGPDAATNFVTINRGDRRRSWASRRATR